MGKFENKVESFKVCYLKEKKIYFIDDFLIEMME